MAVASRKTAAVVDIGNYSGGEMDKFKRFGLTARKGKKAPDIPR